MIAVADTSPICYLTNESNTPAFHATLPRAYSFVIKGQKTNEQSRRILCACNGPAHIFACQV